MKIIGNKINLRDWEIKDLALFNKWNSGKHLWMDFNGPYYAKLNQEQIEKKTKSYQRKIATNDWANPRERLVIADQKLDQFLGTVNWYWQSKETNWKSIGIAIYDEAYWSKGIGFEALTLWIEYLFKQDQNLARLDLRTWSGNFGMLKLAEKLGLQEEACFRKARMVNGKYFDGIGMGILREEWKK